MRALVAVAPGRLELTDEAVEPVARAGEAIVAVEGCGICGGDVEDFLDPAKLPSRLPLVPGHEAWGRVTRVGPGVAETLLGQPVAVDPSLPCGHCAPCADGRGNVCLERGAVGVTQAGGWAERLAAPAENLHVLGDAHLRAGLGVLIEPLACAQYGVQRLGPSPGREALIYGAGTMGLLLALLLRDAGVEPLTIVEPNPARRARAEALTGARAVSPDALEDRVAPMVVDASGSPAAIEDALRRVDRSGTVLLFGLAPPDARVPLAPYQLLKRDVSIVTAFAIRGTFPAAVETAARLAPALAPLVTHEFPLARHDDAFAALRSGEAVKVSLRPHEVAA
jgi:2-desacetyl-2-hydroxyethyl bacteriochlorophyllide A dehydrogenase